MMKYGLGSEIIIEVTGLSVKTRRTSVVRQLLAEQLGVAVKAQFPDTNLVECFIHPFYPSQGFWSSKHGSASLSANVAHADVLEMLVCDYFLPDRFRKAGLAQQMRGRIVTACMHAS